MLSVVVRSTSRHAALSCRAQRCAAVRYASAAAKQYKEKIEGDQTTKAVFFCPHPSLARCDREVVFVCVEGEWRAEG